MPRAARLPVPHVSHWRTSRQWHPSSFFWSTQTKSALGEGIATTDIGRDALQRVAIHQLALIHGMTQAANLVLDLTQSATSLGIDDFLKAVLMGIALLRDEV